MKHPTRERFFITGGMGYIGTVFTREALKKGHTVCIYDALIYEQSRSRIVKEITGSAKPSPKLTVIIGDTRNTELLVASIKKFEPTYVMHWGDLSSPYSCDHHPSYTEEVSHVASKNIVDICEKLKIKMFFNSTSSLYGAQKELRMMTEKDLVPPPTDNYCGFKLKMEKYIKEKVKKNPKFKIIVFRPATIFGLSPRFRIELLPNHFTYMGIVNKVIKLSDGGAYRGAMDINELVKGYFKVIEKGVWNHLIYNIGHYNMTKMEFAEGVQKVTHCDIGTMENALQDFRNLQLDCSLFNNEFNFTPTTPYETTIKNVATWIEKNLTHLQKTNFAELLNMPLATWKKISQ